MSTYARKRGPGLAPCTGNAGGTAGDSAVGPGQAESAGVGALEGEPGAEAVAGDAGGAADGLLAGSGGQRFLGTQEHQGPGLLERSPGLFHAI